MKTYGIMNTFETKEIKGDCRPIVMATTYKDPLDDINVINQIENDLREMNITEGKIMFDLLTSIGDNSERFSTIFFDGSKFNLTSYAVIQVSKKSDIRKSMTPFLNKLDNQLENTVLNSTQIKLIRNGITI